MALLEWSSTYATGNPEVDGAHRLLIGRVNRIAARQPESGPEQGELVQSRIALYQLMAAAARSTEADGRRTLRVEVEDTGKGVATTMQKPSSEPPEARPAGCPCRGFSMGRNG